MMCSDTEEVNQKMFMARHLMINAECIKNTNFNYRTKFEAFSPIDTVSCGSHRAKNCSDCSQGNGTGWCAGDCTLKADECVASSKQLLYHLKSYII